MKKRMATLILLTVAGCGPTGVALAPPPPPPPAPPPPVQKFASDGRWTISRVTAPGGYFCAATTEDPGPRLAITETTQGLIGLDAPDTTGKAVSGGTYALAVTFSRQRPLVFDASVNAPGRLATLPAEPGRQTALTRALNGAPAATIEARPLGTLGTWDLSGSANALDVLGRCTKAG